MFCDPTDNIKKIYILHIRLYIFTIFLSILIKFQSYNLRKNRTSAKRESAIKRSILISKL